MQEAVPAEAGHLHVLRLSVRHLLLAGGPGRAKWALALVLVVVRAALAREAARRCLTGSRTAGVRTRTDVDPRDGGVEQVPRNIVQGQL